MRGCLRWRPVQRSAGWDRAELLSWRLRRLLKFLFTLSVNAGKAKKYLLLCVLLVHQWGEPPVNHYYSHPQRYTGAEEQLQAHLCPDQQTLTAVFSLRPSAAQECGIHTKQECYPLAFGVPAALMVVALGMPEQFQGSE